jgi:hypothetical protein
MLRMLRFAKLSKLFRVLKMGRIFKVEMTCHVLISPLRRCDVTAPSPSGSTAAASTRA